jgi:hydroxyacylglutathione hydrolase
LNPEEENMTMKIKQFRYSADNLGYLIYGENEAMAVDGGAVEKILSFVREKNLRLTYVTNTHSHGDHTVGTRRLLETSGAAFLDNKTVREKKAIELADSSIAVYHTPGHTADSVTFHVNNLLVTGDTLFNGTVGNCFSGDLKGFYHSLKHLMSLPDDTVVYAGHDYVKDSMAAARRIEPENQDIDRFLAGYTGNLIRSTLADERKINPYLRFNEPAVVAFLEKQGLAVGTAYERWESIMTID